MTFHKASHGIIKLLFGDFNGVQAFVYPWTLLWWISGKSLLYTITGLLTNQRYLFPLTVFLILMMYMAFILVKNTSAILSGERTVSQAERKSLAQMAVNAHKLLLIGLAVALLIYLLGSFLKYYYGLLLPLREIYQRMFQGFSIILIVAYTLKNAWTKHYREQGDSMDEAFAKVRGEIVSTPGVYALHGAALCCLILIGCFIYNLLILNLIYTLADGFGIAPDLKMLPPFTILALLYDAFLLGIAFLLSNLLFSPIVILSMHFSARFLPHNRIKQEVNADEQTE